MANFTTKLGGDLEDIERIITEKLLSRSKIEAFRRQVKPIIEDAINDVVISSKDLFNPRSAGGDELVGQLGIGVGGTPANNKIDNAFRLLKVGEDSPATKLKTSFQPRNFRRFGTISYEIDKPTFFSQRITTYRSQRAREPSLEIPWMQNFIEGIEVKDHEFVSQGDEEFRDSLSRTGLGHMVEVPGQQFVFPGVGERATFGKLVDNINRKLISSQFKSRLKTAILAALGD